MANLSKFRMLQYRDGNHREDTPYYEIFDIFIFSEF